MKQFAEFSLEELNKRKATLKGILIGFIVLAIIIAMGFAYIYFFRSKNFNIATLIPLFVLPITWMPIFFSIKSLNNEIELRKSKKY